MAHIAGDAGKSDWRCERTGEERIEGRDTVAFRAVSGTEELHVGWIDRERKFPLRVRTADGTVIALTNIRDQPQASSFELPPNARKFSPEALIERIKQSDVWVSDQHDGESAER